MYCVIQTGQFTKAVKNLSLSDDELHSIVSQIATNPEIGDLIPGTGGARKWRVGTKQKGKRSGYRVVSFFGGEDIPVFLLEIFAKGERINLSKHERNELKKILGDIAENYRQSVRDKVSQLKETGT